MGINPLEELRLLDYGQRLTTHKRNIFYSEEHHDSGRYAVHMALMAGRKAMNNPSEAYFKVGEPLNAAIYDAASPLLATSSLDNLASTLVYATDASLQLGTIAYGKIVLTPDAYEDIKQNFAATLSALKTR